jgi:TFIIF-interacting CTD phosphatase-like protein
MKLLYELILFSFGTPEYVDPILNILEKKEKYFEYSIYRHHATLNGVDYVKG